MRPSIFIIILVLALLSIVVIHRYNKRMAQQFTSSQSNQAASENRPAAQLVTPSDFTLTSGEHELKIGEKRKYLLYIPTSYDATQATPLILFFHGGGGHMEQAAADYGWKEKADQEGFIVAFPNGSSRLLRQHLATWNAGNCCGYARDQKVDDVGFVRQVIADIERQANIDTGKIFATGMSNGGMMAHRLACDMADTFAAVASVAGTDGTPVCTPSRPISVMHIHAKDDTHVLYGGGAGEDVFRDESKVADFTSVDETVRRWVERNRVDTTPKRVLEVPGAYGDLYTSKQNNAQVVLVVAETGGHFWPGGRIVRGKSPSRAFNADDIIWNFFSAQTK
ncbi:MAG: PHB depolymerase family esterase [Candidatus Moraniibacteriota bacterium]